MHVVEQEVLFYLSWLDLCFFTAVSRLCTFYDLVLAF